MALIDCPGCGNKVSDRAKACPKYTLIEIAEQAREDFAMEFDGCTQKDVVRVVSKLANRNNGILQSLVAEILEQYE